MKYEVVNTKRQGHLPTYLPSFLPSYLPTFLPSFLPTSPTYNNTFFRDTFVLYLYIVLNYVFN